MKKYLFSLLLMLVGINVFAQSKNEKLAEKYTGIFITNIASNISLSEEEKEVILIAKKEQLLAQFISRDSLKKKNPQLFREETIRRSRAFNAALFLKFGKPRAKEIIKSGRPKK